MAGRHNGAARKKWANCVVNSEVLEYHPAPYTYTFDFYQHLILPSDFTLRLWSGPLAASIHLPLHLNGQPIKVMAKDSVTGLYLWDFELWHEALL
jgi:hypothetical protein